MESPKSKWIERRVRRRVRWLGSGLVLPALIFCLSGLPCRGENIAQWDFNGNLNARTAHAALAAGAAAPAAGPGLTFEPAQIRGANAAVAHFSRGTYFRMKPGFGPNGGGRFLNRYTLIVDVQFPDRSPSLGWASILQTNTDNTNDGDWFVNPDGGLGISGAYGGSVPAGQWRRLALAVDLVAGTLASYIDGVQVQVLAGQTLDARFSLYTRDDGNLDGILLFADESGDNAEGLVDAVQLRDTALCPEDLAAIGGISSGPLAPDFFPPKICQVIEPDELEIKEGPYLQWATLSEITILWETNLPADSTVFYKRGGGGWQESSIPGNVRIHEIRLSGFSPSEVVEYSVRSRVDDREIASGAAHFQTNPPAAGPYRFVIWGDNQANPPVFTALVQRMLLNEPDLGMSVGDVVDDGNDYYRWGDELLTPLRPLAQSVPFYVAIGNHEVNSHWFYDYIAQPGNEHWFSFDYSGCHFVIIDSNYPFGPGSEQYDWLRQDLFSPAAQQARWLFTFHHHPAYSEIYEEVVYARLRMHLVPLFEAAGVDMDFTGHIHDYERGVYVPPDTGRRIAYIQTSGAGGRLWDDEFDGDWEQIEKVVQYVHHYCTVDINGTTLQFKAIDIDGNIIDSLTLEEMPRHGEPPPPPPPPGSPLLTQWDFDGGGLASTFGAGELQYYDRDAGVTQSLTHFGSTAQLGIPAIQGQPAHVMQFPKSTEPSMGFLVETGAPPNGGGGYINEYTLIFDLFLPENSFAAGGMLSLFNSNASNANDGEMFIRMLDGAVGVDGSFDGNVARAAWQRLALVFAVSNGRVELRKYIDGAPIGVRDLGAIDGRWSLYSGNDQTPWFFLLADDDGDGAAGYLNSFLFASRALTPAEVGQLGGPAPGGILSGPCIGDCAAPFRRGDANGDGSLDLSDAVFSLIRQFFGGQEPACEKSLDADDDGAVDVSDAVVVLLHLFVHGPPPAEPFGACGPDPTSDALDCDSFNGCI